MAVARSREPLRKLQSEFPNQVAILAADLGDLSSNMGQEAVDLAVGTYGHLDGLIINHGVLNPVKRIGDTDAKEWSEAFDINVFSAIAMVGTSPPLYHYPSHLLVDQSSSPSPASNQGNHYSRLFWRSCRRVCHMGCIWSVQSCSQSYCNDPCC